MHPVYIAYTTRLGGTLWDLELSEIGAVEAGAARAAAATGRFDVEEVRRALTTFLLLTAY